MAAVTNPYFNQSKVNEQTLFENFKIEAIQVKGSLYYYIPRKVEKLDLIMGEDILSSFSETIPLEMYMEDVSGFAGENELYSKFGLEIRSTYTLTVSKKRWEKEVIKASTNFMLVKNRPQEGDLIYDPLTKSLFEIKFVDHDKEFYQVGKNYLYQLSCELFTYSSEELNTGISEIDDIGILNDINELNFQLLTESGDTLVFDGSQGSFIQDKEDPQIFSPGVISANRDDEFNEFTNDLKLTIKNPFGS